jgi:hypothetical protein
MSGNFGLDEVANKRDSRFCSSSDRCRGFLRCNGRASDCADRSSTPGTALGRVRQTDSVNYRRGFVDRRCFGDRYGTNDRRFRSVDRRGSVDHRDVVDNM